MSERALSPAHERENEVYWQPPLLASKEIDIEENYQSGLPPEDARTASFNERFATPLDDRGLVDIDALVAVVDATVEENYRWRGEKDIHHLYWPDWRYKQPNFFNQNARLLKRFVNLPQNKLVTPREFHNVTHRSTHEVTPPSDDVMEHQVWAWQVAASTWVLYDRLKRRSDYPRLRQSALDHGVIPKTAEDNIGQEYIQDSWTRHFQHLEFMHTRLERVPDEFRVLEPEAVEPILAIDDPSRLDGGREEYQEIGKRLDWSVGRLATRGAADLRMFTLKAA